MKSKDNHTDELFEKMRNLGIIYDLGNEKWIPSDKYQQIFAHLLQDNNFWKKIKSEDMEYVQCAFISRVIFSTCDTPIPQIELAEMITWMNGFLNTDSFYSLAKEKFSTKI